MAKISEIPFIRRFFRSGTPAPEGGEPATVKGRGGVRKALAVKCDLCAERGDMACIYYCPYSAIERVNPQELVR